MRLGRRCRCGLLLTLIGCRLPNPDFARGDDSETSSADSHGPGDGTTRAGPANDGDGDADSRGSIGSALPETDTATGGDSTGTPTGDQASSTTDLEGSESDESDADTTGDSAVGEDGNDQCPYDASCGSVPEGMACVAAGLFEMGSTTGDDDERPVRDVCMPTYHIDKTEVTVRAYALCVAAGGACIQPEIGGTCNWGVDGRDDHPVNCVDWTRAVAYCAWADKRLPTEAEWEKAARGTDARAYPWGAVTPSCEHTVMEDVNAGGNGCGYGSTSAVASKSPAGDSPYGVHDMAGNVYEWTATWHDEGYDPMQTDNPQGPNSGSEKTLRSGAWTTDFPRYLGTTDRYFLEPNIQSRSIGFRCARSRS